MTTYFQDFVDNLNAASVYKKWLSSSPNDAKLWTAFYQAVLAGENPTPPVMNTAFGKALVDAGKLALTPVSTSEAVYGTSSYGQSTY